MSHWCRNRCVTCAAPASYPPPLRESVPAIETGLVWRSAKVSPVLAGFIDIARAHAAQLPDTQAGHVRIQRHGGERIARKAVQCERRKPSVIPTNSASEPELPHNNTMLIHPNFDPVAIHLGPLPCAGMTDVPRRVHRGDRRRPAAAALAVSSRRKAGRRKTIDDMLFYGVLGTILGRPARLRAVLQSGAFISRIRSTSSLAVEGGMSFHGGFLGVTFAMVLFALSAQTLVAAGHRLRRADGADRTRCGRGSATASSTASCGGA